jgi:hypothetical protein
MSNLYKINAAEEPDLIAKTKDEARIQHILRQIFNKNNANLGIASYFLDKDIFLMKKRFSYTGQMAEYLNNFYEVPWLPYRFSNFSYTLCSDHKELIARFGTLKIPNSVKAIGQTENCVMLAMMDLIREDWTGVAQYISVLEDLAQKPKPSVYTPIHIATLKAFMAQDAVAIQKALIRFEDKKLKAHRKKVNIDEKFVSIVPLGYAKLAWLQGMEIQLDSEYIPKDWLPYQPLEEYTIPYWFLRDYYRSQGVNWRYDPIYPEIQAGW